MLYCIACSPPFYVRPLYDRFRSSCTTSYLNASVTNYDKKSWYLFASGKFRFDRRDLMLVARRALCNVRCSHLSKSGQEISLNSRRTFLSSAVETLSEGFLDFAIALPLPPSLPPYATTIITVTIISRLVFTVPFSIWVCTYTC